LFGLALGLLLALGKLQGLSFVFTSFLPSLLLLAFCQQNRHCLHSIHSYNKKSYTLVGQVDKHEELNCGHFGFEVTQCSGFHIIYNGQNIQVLHTNHITTVVTLWEIYK